MSTRKILFKNTIASFLSQFLLLGLGIITTPYVVHKLGDSEYGIISIVMIFIGYLSFLDLGIGWAIIKFVAEYKAHDSRNEIKKIVQTSLSVFLAGGLFVIIIIFLTGEYLVLDVFSIPEHLQKVSMIAFQLASIGFLVNMLASIYGSVLNGYQRFDITNSIRVIYGILNISGTVLLLYSGFGLLQVIIWNFLIAIFNFILLYLTTKKIDSNITLKPVFNKNTFNKIFSFSLYTLVSKIGLQLIYNIEKSFISAFLPIKMLTYYIIPFNIASKITLVPTTLGSVIYPTFSTFNAGKEYGKLQDLFFRTQKYIFFSVFPMVFVLGFFAAEILRYWLGEKYSQEGTMPMRVLLCAFLLNSITSEDAILFDGIGKPKIGAIIVTVSGVVNIVASYFFVRLWGINGGSFAILLSFVICGSGLMFYSKKFTGISIFKRITTTFLPVAGISIILMPLLYYLSRFINGLFSLFIVLSLCFLILYSFLFMLFFSKKERNELINSAVGSFKIKNFNRA